MTQNGGQLMSYLTIWDSYREIWELDKEAFIRRYQRLNPPVSSFDADIARYCNEKLFFVTLNALASNFSYMHSEAAIKTFYSE